MALRQFNAAMEEIQLDKLKSMLPGDRLVGTRKNASIAFYSTFCGHERAMSLAVPVHAIPADFYFISNNPACLSYAQKLGWIPFHLKIGLFDDPLVSAHQAKIAKALPHLFDFLLEHERSFYMDDKFKFDGDLLSAVENNLSDRNSEFLASYHRFLSGNVLFELVEAMGQARYFTQRRQTVEFIMRRLEEGDCLKMGSMYETGLIMRKTTAARVKQINEEWYQAILQCGIECQISFNFIAQRYPEISGFDSKRLGFK
jgi:hypothetical protein